MIPLVKAETEPDGEGGANRYFCPYPGCKRSFAELWRLKVHYRAPPDIRGSGKERGHGTELSHCPKCGKGLKPGKHHVGCSGGKTAPRQAKRPKVAGNGDMMAQDGMMGDPQGMYGGGMMMSGGYGGSMPCPPMSSGFNQMNTYNQQYPPMQQQYQADMPGYYPVHTQAHTQQLMPGGMMQQPHMQPQPQSGGSFSSPVLGMNMMDNAQAAGQLGHAGSGDMASTQYYQQQPQQMQPLVPLQQQAQSMMMQQPQMQQQDYLQAPMQPQQPGMDMMSAPQQLQPPPYHMQQTIKQEVVSVPGLPATLVPQQHQQPHMQPAGLMGHQQEQGYSHQEAAAAGLMPPPPPIPMINMMQPPEVQPPAQQHQPVHDVVDSSITPPETDSVAPAISTAAPSSASAAPNATISSTLFDEIDNVPAAGASEAAAAAEQAAGAQSRAPSPPPLPPDFPLPSSGVGTLFNFSQFSQKLPASAGPSQQMAMMPRGMEQELPPSMDDLWTPEATYDHHSDGDLMQLLFGAPEQPPTMATIHLHHFLEDDACSSPLLTGLPLLGGSMDDLKAAEANHVQSDAAAAAQETAAAAVQPAFVPVADQKDSMVPPAATAEHLQSSVPNGIADLPKKAVDSVRSIAAEQPLQHVVQQHHTCLVPTSNGLLNGQCGAAVQVQMHVQLQMQMHPHDAAAGVLPIKSEDACLLQKAGVPSIAEAVASRAT